MTREEAIKQIQGMVVGAEWLSDYMLQALNMAVEALMADVPDTNVGKWVLCSDRLPEPGKHYLITTECNGENYVTSDDYFSYGWDDFGDDVIAWMELPEPYREESEMGYSVKGIKQLPSAEPEQKHGYWRYAEFLYAFICSNCGRSAISCYDYCPCCGVEMRMKDEN